MHEVRYMATKDFADDGTMLNNQIQFDPGREMMG
jgi:hypothetical protein